MDILIGLTALCVTGLCALFLRLRRFEKEVRASLVLPVHSKEADHTARMRIAESIAAQTQYEKEHHERRYRPGTDRTLPVEVHYTDAQRKEAIRQRVIRAYHLAKQRPPDGLRVLIDKAMESE